MAKHLVDRPDQVKVAILKVDVERTLFRIHVAPDDMGKIIGNGGRTASAIRIILRGISMTSRQRFSLDIVGEVDVQS